MNKLATSLTLAAVIMFDVSGTDLQPIQLTDHSTDQNFSRRNSIAALEHVTTPPIVTQTRSRDDSDLAMRANGSAIIHHAGEMRQQVSEMVESGKTLGSHIRNFSQAVLDKNLSKALDEITDREVQRACSNCIGATGGFFSSLKEIFKSLKRRLSGSSSSELSTTAPTA